MVVNAKLQRQQSAIRCNALLAIGFETFMECDIALRDISVKRKNEEYFLGDALVD